MIDCRVVFFGTPAFSIAALEALLADHWQVIAAVSQPDKEVGRKRVLQKTKLKEYAEAHDIPVLQPVRLKDSPSDILNLHPDLIVTCAYGQLIPEVILKAPKYGCVNIHPSPLPKYRGGAPVQRAIMNGDPSTEVCLMEMAKKMDSGRVYARIPHAIGPDVTGTQLFEELKPDVRRLIHEYLPMYLEGKLPGEAQDDALAVLAPNIERDEEQLHFQSESLTVLYNHARGLIEDPMPYGLLEGKRIKFCRIAKKEGICEKEPGTVLGLSGRALEIAADGGVLQVYELQPEGKQRMAASAWFNGAGRNTVGRQFE